MQTQGSHQPGPQPPRLLPSVTRQGAGLDHAALATGDERRRGHIRRIEDAIDQACEAAALGHAPRGLTRDRSTWDRRAWTRYMAEAVSQAGRHGTRIAQLRREAAQVDRLAKRTP